MCVSKLCSFVEKIVWFIIFLFCSSSVFLYIRIRKYSLVYSMTWKNVSEMKAFTVRKDFWKVKKNLTGYATLWCSCPGTIKTYWEAFCHTSDGENWLPDHNHSYKNYNKSLSYLTQKFENGGSYSNDGGIFPEKWFENHTECP